MWASYFKFYFWATPSVTKTGHALNCKHEDRMPLGDAGFPVKVLLWSWLNSRCDSARQARTNLIRNEIKAEFLNNYQHRLCVFSLYYIQIKIINNQQIICKQHKIFPCNKCQKSSNIFPTDWNPFFVHRAGYKHADTQWVLLTDWKHKYKGISCFSLFSCAAPVNSTYSGRFEQIEMRLIDGKSCHKDSI